ncbi:MULTISPECIES: hypothetical protein [Flavobacterium]|uniref:hypothetical protein n=1 Tax=Flavobacterium TaxID=237 RepID=UPI002113A9C4|nr:MULTISPECIES: hypothetical protein [Flavobacterium]UUF12265.1 hypothetical protein NLJ00_13500 [Flavobacterium panici]
MEVIRLQVKPEAKEKLFQFLRTFSSDEINVIIEDEEFHKNKRKLEATIAKIENGTAKFVTFEEMDEILEKTISKYEK